LRPRYSSLDDKRATRRERWRENKEMTSNGGGGGREGGGRWCVKEKEKVRENLGN